MIGVLVWRGKKESFRISDCMNFPDAKHVHPGELAGTLLMYAYNVYIVCMK